MHCYTEGMAGRQVTIRMNNEVNTQIQKLADEMHISYAGALHVLVSEALAARERLRELAGECR